MLSPELETLAQLLTYIHEDVKDIKTTLNGGDGLVAKVKVLEDARSTNTRHFTLIWSAIVTLTASIIRIIFK